MFASATWGRPQIPLKLLISAFNQFFYSLKYHFPVLPEVIGFFLRIVVILGNGQPCSFVVC
jgi:hypothetical protein